MRVKREVVRAILSASKLERKNERHGMLGTFIADLVLQVLAYCAQFEREAILTRQRQGIAEAKKRGVRFGRPRRKMPPEFAEAVEMCFVRLAALHSFV